MIFHFPLYSRASELSPRDIYCLAYYLGRVEFHCDENNSSLDSNVLATLWLMTLDLPPVQFSEYLDLDSKTLSLLASANIITRLEDHNQVPEQVSHHFKMVFTKEKTQSYPDLRCADDPQN